MLQKLILQHFRSYSQQKFDFDPHMTIIVGQNTAGKTNLVEAVMLLASGKSFRTSNDREMIAFGQEVARVQGILGESGKRKALSMDSNTSPFTSDASPLALQVTIAQGDATGGRLLKRFSVNDVPKSRNTFVGNLPAVLFNPETLEIIVDGPGLRRAFLTDVLESVDGAYVRAKTLYDKALRQRNALLNLAQETGRRDTQQFVYWDELLITNGQLLTKKREEFITFVNNAKKPLFDFQVFYDKSVMSKERLLQYAVAEVASGMTLVGPQRDDFVVEVLDPFGEKRNIAHFGSRGQQRLVVLQLKLLHMRYVEEVLCVAPLLVLDDILSELDDRHIDLVLQHIKGRQVILTTTHKEFVADIAKKASVVELKEAKTS